jgi:hypothetical protein
MKRRREEREKAKAAKEAAEAVEKDGKTADGKADEAEAVKEAEKIAGQASATKVKRARNGTRAKSGNGSRAKPRAKR